MIGKDVVKKVADVARLELTKGELDEFSKDLASILEAFRTLNRVKTDKVKPTFQPVYIKDVTRPDAVEPSLPHSEALANTGNREEGSFKGPKVV